VPAKSADIRPQARPVRKPGRTITRLPFRGWKVDVDGTVVTVPHHVITTQRLPDLQVCLAAADAIARNNARPTTAPPATRAHRPTATDILIPLLQDARAIAENKWHPTNLDIYTCTRTAWDDAAYDVPFTEVLRALRAGLEPGTNLTEFSATAPGHAAIASLYDTAIAALTQAAGDARGAA